MFMYAIAQMARWSPREIPWEVPNLRGYVDRAYIIAQFHYTDSLIIVKFLLDHELA